MKMSALNTYHRVPVIRWNMGLEIYHGFFATFDDLGFRVGETGVLILLDHLTPIDGACMLIAGMVRLSRITNELLDARFKCP